MGRMKTGRAPPAGQILHRLVGRTAHAAPATKTAPCAVFLRKRIGAGSPGNPRGSNRRCARCCATPRDAFDGVIVAGRSARGERPGGSRTNSAVLRAAANCAPPKAEPYLRGKVGKSPRREDCPSLEMQEDTAVPRAHAREVWLVAPEGLDTDASTRAACRARWSRRRRRSRCARSRAGKRAGPPSATASTRGAAASTRARAPASLETSSVVPGCSWPGRSTARPGYEEARGAWASPRRAAPRGGVDLKGDAGAASGSSRGESGEIAGTRRARRERSTRLPRCCASSRARRQLPGRASGRPDPPRAEPYRMFSSRVDKEGGSVRPEEEDGGGGGEGGGAALGVVSARAKEKPPPPRRIGYGRRRWRRWRRCGSPREWRVWARCRRRQTRATAERISAAETSPSQARDTRRCGRLSRRRAAVTKRRNRRPRRTAKKPRSPGGASCRGCFAGRLRDESAATSASTRRIRAAAETITEL